MGGAGVCMGLHPPQSKKHMAGNIVRLGRGCPSQSVQDHARIGGEHCHSLQAASRGESDSHMSQLSIGEADSL